MINKNEIDLSFLNNNIPWLRDRTAFVTVAGSHAYGMAREGSDIDLRAIAIAPRKYNIGVFSRFEHAEFKDPYDCFVFDIKKFVKLAAECNPNCIELMFTDPNDFIHYDGRLDELFENKNEFLSKRARGRFVGYAYSQLKRIQLHRTFLLKGEIERPTREQFGLICSQIPKEKLLEIEAAISKKLNQWNIDTTGMEISESIIFKNNLADVLIDLKINSEEFEQYAVRSIGLNDSMAEEFKKESRYKAAMREYKAFIEHKQSRNAARYELEKKFGLDTKHAAHLIRLLVTCEHLLKTGEMIVKRDDAEFLLSIRDGAYSYDQIIEMAEAKKASLEKAFETCSLPNHPNMNKIEDIVVNIIERNP